MNNISVSVIVAVYNAEKTLIRLTDSLKAQTMHDYEVLLIDDGSTDSSGSICDSIAESDPRFKVFHKPNEGVGATRRFGLEHAIGDYTIHADADDWVEPDYLEELYNKAISSEADMTICDFYFEEGWRSTYVNEEPRTFEKDGLVKDFLLRLQKGSCNKLIKRETYTKRGITYKDGLNFSEDYIFNLQLLLSGIKVAYVPKALYHYDIATNPVSASRGNSLKQIEQRERFISILKELLPEGYENIIDNRSLDVVYLVIQSNSYTPKEFLNKYSDLKRVKWKDYYNKSFSIKLIIWSSLHLSYRLALFLNKIKMAVRQFKQTHHIG